MPRVRRLLLALLCACSSSRATVEAVDVPAPSLAATPFHASASQPALVVLPASYASSGKRFPVLYYLPGFSMKLDDFRSSSIGGFRVDDLRVEMIVVFVDGRNALGGGFYAGPWEGFVAKDLVDWVDSRFRTIADRSGRVLAGESMGGFGALSIAMQHADRFRAVYAISPALFAPGRAAVRGVFDDEVLAAHERAHADLDTPAALVAHVSALQASAAPLDQRRAFAYAYWAAFADGAPFPTGPESPALDRLGRGFGGWDEKIAAHAGALRSLDRIGIDYGRRDRFAFIPPGAEHVAAKLTAIGARVELSAHDGGHDDRWRERFERHALPMLSSLVAPR